MNVLLVTAVVAGGVGGHVRQLARGLSAAGHRVVVACPPQVATQFDLTATGAGVVPLELGARARPLQDLGAVRTVRAVCGGADMVHAHGLRAGAVAALAMADGGTPLVVTSHNAPPAGTVASVVYRGLEALVCRRADVVLGVSPDLVERARARGARETGLAVVPAAVGPPLTEEERKISRASVRGELGLAADRQVVVSVGRLSAQKRMDALVAAHHRLAAQADGAVHARDTAGESPLLLVVGDGPEHARLLRQADAGLGEVLVLGRRNDVPRLLAAADLAVSAACWEGQPLFLQEALAAGAPVVATDVGGSDLVLGGAGLLVPGGDDVIVQQLADAMARVLGDASRRSELAQRSRRRAAELPSAEDAVGAVLSAYGCAASLRNG